MSYQEKRTGASIFGGVLVLAAYCIYAFGKYRSGVVAPDDLKFWAITMLVFVGIGIGVSVAIQIIFSILFSISVAVKRKLQDESCDDKEIDQAIKVETVEDERDKLIELKSMRVGFIIAGVGMIGGLVALALNYSAAVMLNIIYLSFLVGSLCEGAGQLYYYRKGA